VSPFYSLKRVRPQDATPEEAAWIMAGSVLELLEIGGPEAVREQLENLPPVQRKDIVRAVSASGYPARETLGEFRTLVAEPILHAPARPHAVQGTWRPRPRKPHRRYAFRLGLHERATPQ
jgi:hypothetical protein